MLVGAIESGLPQSLVFHSHRVQQSNRTHGSQQKDQHHAAKPKNQGETQAPAGTLGLRRRGYGHVHRRSANPY